MKSQQSAHGRGPNKKDKLPLVSVIIPVYNVAPYIREAVDSAIKQTYRQLEIIIVEDGSTDGSQGICDEYRSDPRVQVIHQAHQGVSNARNTGLDHATGEYIAFLDPDDAYQTDFIALMLDAIKGADAAVCRYEIHKHTLDSKGYPVPIAKAGSYNRAEALRARVDESISASVWNKLFRSDLWKNVRFPDGHNYEDVDTTFRVLNLCSRVNVIDQTLYLYRMRPGSITHTSSRKNIEDWFLAYDHVAAFVQAHIPEIFDETHLRKVRQTRINKALHSFCLGHMSIDELKDVFEGEKTEHLSFRSRAAYQMARLCPCLLRALYAPYRSFRMKRRKVSER